MTDEQLPGPTRGSLVVIFLTVFIDLLGFGMVLPLLPNYARQFTVDQSGLTVGLLMASYSAMQFIFAPLWGRLSDRIGRRPVLLVGLAGSVVFYTLFGVATVMRSLLGLFLARIGAGIAGATISTAQAYIADSTTLQNRAKGMALIGAAFGVGFTFGPLLAYLALPTGEGDPGPGPGYAAAALSSVALLLAWFKLPESLRPGSPPARRAWFNLAALRESLWMPSVGPILAAIFICVVAFATFETTIAMLVKGNAHDAQFHFSFREICLLFAYIGFSLALIQGLIVRRLSDKVPEGVLATAGSCIEIAGFWMMSRAATKGDLGWLMASLSTVVLGFALLTPSLNSLLSRRSDPAKQGAILGVGQSLSALARIIGPLLGVPLLQWDVALPYEMAMALMAVGLLMVLIAARHGHDFAATSQLDRQ